MHRFWLRSSAFGALASVGDAMRRLADLIVPPACVACHAPLAAGDALCPRCWRTVTFIRAPLCDRLGIPLPFGGTGGPLISAAAAADPPVYDRARAATVFGNDGTVRDLIHGLKYGDRHEAVRLVGRWMLEAGRDILADADVLVPVPLTRWRLMRRQFNQSAMLARMVSAGSGVPTHVRALVKTRTPPPQAGLTRDQRRHNVRGAFAVPQRHKAAIAGRRVVLVDDVITTGATVEACARTLKAAGAVRVDVLAAAIVTRPVQVTV